MKKILLGTSMLFGFAGAAFADTPKVTVGGVADFQAGYVDQDLDAGLHDHSMRSDTEITFRIDAKTQAGLEYGAAINLEADVSADADNQGLNASQTFVYLGGIFGRFELGSNLGADQTLKVGAESIARATGGIDGDFYYYVNQGVGGASPVIATPDLPINYGRGNFGDESSENLNKITYYTPRFVGFQAGVSYSATDVNRGQAGVLTSGPVTTTGAATVGGIPTTFATTAAGPRAQNIFQGGVNYDNKFGDFGVTLSATGEYGNSDSPGFEDLRAYAVGGKVAYMGFTVAGSYGDLNDSLQTVASNNDHSYYWTAGGAYEFGPFGASVTYLKSELDLGVGQNKFDNLSVGLDYKLAPGPHPLC